VIRSNYILFVATQVGVYLLVALGLNFLSGFGGQVSLGHGALVAIGAYATGLLMVDHGWPWWPAMVAGMAGAAVVGALMALPAFRVSAWYFALITLGFAEVLQGLLVEWRRLTHGFAGVVGIAMPALGGYVFEARDLFWLVAAVDVAGFIVIRHLVGGRFGRGLVAVREAAVAAMASGVSLVRLKMFAFVLSAAMAGLAGALFAAQKSVITPDDFTGDFSVFFLLVVVAGGAGSLWGPVLGTLVFFVVPELLTALATWRVLIYGVALLALMLWAPHGLAGALAALGGRLGRRASTTTFARPAAASAPPVSGMTVSIDRVHKSFGGVAALTDVSLEIAARTIHAIVGPNGSGKTTLLNVVSRFYAPDRGAVRFEGVTITGSASAVARRGVGRTFQTPRLLPGMSVLENVMLGAYAAERAIAFEIALRLPRARREHAQILSMAREYLEFVGLARRAEEAAGELPHGQQRLAEIARALVGRPRLLLLDEPAAGLSLSELDRLGELIRSIRGRGLTVVIVEHHIELVADICDQVTVLDGGAVLATGTPDEAFSNVHVVKAFMGAGAR
jgi:branched-chain amino acid transport system permease protein